MLGKTKTIPPLRKDTMPGRVLKKTGVEKRIFDRAVGLTRPNVYSHRNNIKLHELPY